MVEIVTHGTLDYAELQRLNLSPDDLHVFSSNINPYGPPPAIVDAVREAVTGPNLARYPDRLSAELRAPLAAYHDMEPESVVVGNGTADLMWLVGLLYVQSRRTVVLEPTFGEYANVAALLKTPVQHVVVPGWQRAADGRYVPGERGLDACVAELRAHAPEVVFFCNPNNPTGELYDQAELEQLMAAAPTALWIVDEAYMEFTAAAWSASGLLPEQHIIVLRSMTKDFSLGGIRLGYLVAKKQTAQEIQTAQPPWNVNVLAQAAGLAAMRSLAWRAESMRQLRADTEELRLALQELGLKPRTTTANYFLTPIDDPGALREFLLARGMLIRDCTSFGLVDFFRIATQKPELNRALAAAIGEYVAERGA